MNRKMLLPLAVLLAILALQSSALLPSVFSTPSVWYVAPSPAGTGSSGGSCSHPGFNTISLAITAASAGDTINVCKGTYTEQLVISKSLTITGIYGAKNTILEPPATMTPDEYGAMNIVTITGGTTVATFSGFNVTGPAPLTPGTIYIPTGCAGAYFIGVFVENGATATIANDFISHIRNNVPNDCARAIVVGHDPQLDGAPFTTTGTATITGTTINAYWKSGIDIDQIGSMATIYDNTIEGMGPTTAIAENGIEIVAGAVATVRSNTVSGNTYTGTSGCPNTENYFTACAMAAGILLYDSGSVTVQGNGVSKNDVGIWAYDDSSAPTSFTISWLSNNVHNNYGYGLVFDGVTATSKTNSISNNPVGILATDSSANAYVTSISDQFTGNVVNTEAITTPGTYTLSFIVETQPFTVLQPIQPPTHPHF